MSKRRRGALELSEDIRKRLLLISRSRSQPAAKVMRAGILISYSEGERISEIVRRFDTNRPLVERCIDKSFTYGPIQALSDLPRSGRPRKISDDAISWVLSIACQRPVAIGYAAETWTYSLLLKHIRKHCEQSGHPCLAKLGKGRLNAILSKSNIRPHKIS